MVTKLAKHEGRCKICTLIPPCKHIDKSIDNSYKPVVFSENPSIDTKSKISMKEEGPGLIQILDGVPADYRANS